MELFKILGKFAIDGIEKAAKELDAATDKAKKSTKETDALGESYEKLTHRVKSQETKLEELKRAYANLTLTQGKNSKEAEECAEEISKLSSELKENRDRLKDAEAAANQFDNSLDDVGSSANKSGKDVNQLSSGMGTKIVKAAKAGAAALAALAGAALAVAESTREYRTEMGKLDTAFKMSGHSSNAAKSAYKSLQSILGETDQAVEAANHLAKLCATEQELQTWTDICTGVFATFGDSLPIEGLTEAANETAKVGQVTGVLADALNWAGVSEDEFNKSLAACNSEQERTELITETLINLYKKTADSYKKNNKAIIEANAAQEEWNAAMAKVGDIVEPAVSLIKSGLAKALSYLADSLTATKRAAEELAGSVNTIEEAEEKIAELEKTLEEFPDDPMLWTDEQRREYQFVITAINETKAKIEELQQEQDELAAKADDPAIQMQASVEQFSTNVGELFNKFQETYEGMYEQINGWFAPFEKAKTTVTTNVGEMVAAMQSQIEFNNTYAANLQTLAEYGLGGLAAGFQTLGPEAAAYAQTIVDAVEQAGGASSEAGQSIIQQFQTVDADVQASQENLATNMTLISEDWGTAIDSMVQALAEGVEGMDMDSEALTAAQNTLDGYLQGVEAKKPEIESAMAALGAMITASLQASIGTVYVPVVQASVGAVDGSHAGGLNYVPFDGYIGQLHKGEAVLTAEEAKAWRAGKTSSGSSGNATQSAAPSPAQPTEIVLNLTAEIDGAALARKTYKYNLLEQRNHGTSLINA